MERILNITNGDCAIEVMKKANVSGDFLPWRDVLHDGPVPGGLTLDELSEVRVNFIIERNWGEPENVKQNFIDRDNTLKSFHQYDKVTLWFEHDLYDQLQILQILDWLNQNRAGTTALSMICTDNYLGTLSPEDMTALYQYEQPVSEIQLKLASNAWAAFCSDTPKKWHALLKVDTSALPYLEDAIIRLLEEYPGCKNGLSRTAQQALKIISQGEKRPGKVFGLFQDSEERQFMGDSSFWEILHQLLNASPPLLSIAEGKTLTLPTSTDQELTITTEGEEVLSGKRNYLELTEKDQWLGGVHLTPENTWCWNSSKQMIERY